MNVQNKNVIFSNLSITLKKTGKDLIKDFSYTLESGSILTVMGESGSGKSTLLNFITGIVDTSAFECSGSIECADSYIHTLPPEKRKIGLLVQDNLLFPHMTIEENLLFALPQKVSKEERKSVVDNALKEAQLDQSIRKQYPSTISGGQRARIALMRTLLSHPQLLLLDEPFSQLDINTRKIIREFTFTEIKKHNIPTILVTHDAQDIADTSLVVEL